LATNSWQPTDLFADQSTDCQANQYVIGQAIGQSIGWLIGWFILGLIL
jgi:hypothetical protein